MCSASASTTGRTSWCPRPAVVLAAAAARTKRIRLTSAVTVLSSEDPVRVFQEFATVDLLSGGRAEIMAGRGSFIESFPLFGFDLDDYDELFAEKLELLLQHPRLERVTWSGTHRAPLDGPAVYPRPLQDPLPVWVAVGGNAASAIRAGALGLPMALAIIGGQPERFVAASPSFTAGRPAETGRPRRALSINSHTYVAEDSRRAADEFFPSYSAMMNAIGRERGWAPMTPPGLRRAARPARRAGGGHPEEVVGEDPLPARAVRPPALPGPDQRGHAPARAVMRAIELLGTEVAPRVRAEVARREAKAA